MIRRALFVAVLLAVTLSLSGCCCCCCSPDVRGSRVAREVGDEKPHHEKHKVERGDAGQVRIYLKLSGGELDLTGGGDKLFEGQFTYSAPELRPTVSYDVQDRYGELRVVQKGSATPGRSAGQWRNKWLLRLGTDVPIDLEADVGASDGEIDLGGVHLKSFHLSARAANLKVRFSTPNPDVASTIKVNTGTSRMSFEKLGNANMSDFEFDGGVGTYLFDFGGRWQRSARAYIRTGTGRVTLRLPQDIGVRVCPGDAEVNSDELRRDGECFVNSLYEDAEIRLDIDLDLGVGKLEIKTH